MLLLPAGIRKWEWWVGEHNATQTDVARADKAALVRT